MVHCPKILESRKIFENYYSQCLVTVGYWIHGSRFMNHESLTILYNKYSWQLQHVRFMNYGPWIWSLTRFLKFYYSQCLVTIGSWIHGSRFVVHESLTILYNKYSWQLQHVRFMNCGPLSKDFGVPQDFWKLLFTMSCNCRILDSWFTVHESWVFDNFVQ